MTQTGSDPLTGRRLRPSASPESYDPRVERTRASALEAARAILIEEGWDALTQNRVAERSGLGRATVYRHWPDRLLLLNDALAAEASATTLRIPRTGNLRQDLVNTLEGFCRDLVDRNLGQVLSALVERADRDPNVRNILETLVSESLAFVREILRRAVLAGELRRDLDIDIALSELLGPIAYRRLLTREPLTWEFVRAVVDGFLAANEIPTTTPRGQQGA